MCEDGAVTEGTSCTAFIVVRDRIITRPLSTALLPSITRLAVMRLAKEEGLTVEERLFSVEEAKSANEAFHTSASTLVMPVVQIDGTVIGDGTPGRLTRRLRELYLAMAREEASVAHSDSLRQTNSPDAAFAEDVMANAGSNDRLG